jgi:hypothetical protein
MPEFTDHFIIELFDHKYTEFAPDVLCADSVIRCYQKCVYGTVDGHNIKLYFITLKLYDYKGITDCKPYRYGITAETHTSHNLANINITYNVDHGTTVIDIEKFFNDFYYKMNCEPYDY